MHKQSNPSVINIEKAATNNTNFRTTIWSGPYSQMTLMCIPVCSDIGVEIHKENDQIIRIEQGNALVKLGKCKERLDLCYTVQKGDTIFIPAGNWHNIINVGRMALKLSSIYSPAHHKPGTIHITKEDAQKESGRR